MNASTTRIGLELANQRMDDLHRELAKERLAKATSTSSKATSTARRTVRNALARPFGLLSVGR